MPRRTATPTSTRVHQYGCRDPHGATDVLEDQLFKAHRYRNKLVELDRARRQRYRDILGTIEAVRDARQRKQEAEDRYEELKNAVQQDRQATGRRVTTPESKAAYKAMEQAQKACRAAEKQAAEGLKDEIKASEEQYHAEVREARGQSGLYWGTYLTYENTIRTAALEAQKKGDHLSFAPWRGEAFVAIQIQKGLTIDELLACEDRRIRLELRDDWGTTKRASRYGTFWMRIGSEGREPTWIKIPVFWHRAIPEGAKIKWVQLTRKERGGHSSRRWRWELNVTVQTPGHAMKRKELEETAELRNAVGIDFGWRTMEDGSIRAAYACDHQGNGYDIRLPVWAAERHRLTQELQSIRDRRFDEARNELVEWLPQNNVPDEIRERLETLSRWRSHQRLAKVVARWRELDPGPPAFIEAWRRQERHLYQWFRATSRQLVMWRRELYRHWALFFATRYEHVMIEDVQLSNMKRKPEIGEEREEIRGKHMPASPGELRAQIEKTCLRERVPVFRVPAEQTTKTCASCGNLGIERNRDQLIVPCEACGVRVDQDDNAARIILSWASAGTPRSTSAVPATPNEAWYEQLMKEPKRVQARRARLAALEAERAAAE